MRRFTITLAAVLFAATMAACGDDDDDDDAAPATEPATTETSATDDTGGTATTGSTAPTTDSTAATTPAEEVCTEDRAGGDITMGTFSFTRGLDPAVALGRGSSGGTENTAIYDTLMRWDPEQDLIIPHVAESLEPNADRTEWTLRLQPGITFGNGDPMTTADVQWSVERLAASTVGSAAQAKEITAMAIVDDLEMTFTLARPWGSFDYFFTSEGGMVVNRNVAEPAGEGFATNPVGAGVGPFEVERFAPGEEIVLRAKSDYWGGPVCIDTLRFVYIPGARATYEAFQTGDLDIFYMQEDVTSRQVIDDGVPHHSIDVMAASALLLNNGIAGSDPATADPMVRRAIAHALDLEALNTRVYEGASTGSGALFPDPSLEYPAYDLEAARDLVEDAKAAGWDGEISFVCQDTPEQTELSIAIEAMLTTAGMTVTRENVSQADLTGRVIGAAVNYEVSCWGVSVPEVGAISSLNQWESTSPRNRAAYGSPEMDVALADFMAASGPEETAAAQRAIQEVWNEDVPSVGLFALRWFSGYSEDIKGLTYTRDTIPMFFQAYVDA